MKKVWNPKKILAVVALTALVAVAVTVSKLAVSADPVTLEEQINRVLGIGDETDARAPVDYGSGPGAAVKVETKSVSSMVSGTSKAPSTIPTGTATANVTGVFGAAVTWPVVPIHLALLPDGRVMSFGTNEKGQQGAELYYDIWNPTLGTASNSHLVLSNTTGTDIFCGAQSVMVSGDVLVSGGDLTVAGKRNSANNTTNVFSPTANSLTANTAMNYARWYGSLVSLPNGQLAIFGGRENVGVLTPAQSVLTPELYDPASKVWISLTGATSSAAFKANWYYPRTYVAPGGNLFLLDNNGAMYSISTSGVGSISSYTKHAPPGVVSLPTVPFAPGKVLSIRDNQEAVVIDFTGATPVVTPTASIGQTRFWASGTVMADGTVLISGGSEVANKLTGVAYQTQIWNPATGQWTAGATAIKPRLYHSNALLLPDASVLTGGGGAPGPVINLNAEIYYPPYLYDSSGLPATRPVIESASPLALNGGGTITLAVGPTDTIASLSFVRTGSSTHSNNSDQRFITLPFTQTGQVITAVLPSDPTVLVPGFYMLFAINTAGVPSLATIFNVEQ